MTKVYIVRDTADYEHENDQLFTTEQAAWNAIAQDLFDSYTQFEWEYCDIVSHGLDCEQTEPNNEHYQLFVEQCINSFSVEEVTVND